VKGPIWLFWEGPRPAYLDLCLETIHRYHQDVRLLDRAAFDEIWDDDRDVPLKDIAVNHFSDFVRAWLLSRLGGLYLDIDCIVMRSLAPLLDAAEVHGFVGYREPLGYMSCNFMAARAGGRVIMEHYGRVTDRLQGARPLDWLDLASVPMDFAIAAAGENALLLPTRSVMPLAWNRSFDLARREDDINHDAWLEPDCWCYMLSNNTIGSDIRTRHLAYMPREALLADRSFLSYLLRRGLEHPPVNHGVSQTPEHLGGHEGLTQFDEGTFDYLVGHFGVKSFLDVGCGPGGMVCYALARGLTARGIEGDPHYARGSLFTIEHDFSMGPFNAGDYDLGWAVEFVEHVEQQYVPNFMATFMNCRHVFITAAVPGQPGYHHVNCQWSDYWIARFAEAGFEHDVEATVGVREHSNMQSRFTQQTGLVFTRTGV
jgi:hypothetical protein